jgi:hypothetical protein
VTDASGRANVTLIGGNPRPTNGLATVFARSSGPDGLLVETSSRVLFSGPPQVSLNTPGMGPGAYAYTVPDQLGNPLAEGTSISVTVDGESIATNGNVAVSLQDRISPGYGSTEFSFTITPVVTPGAPAPDVGRLTIEVDGPGNLRPGAAVTGRAPAGR